MKIAVVGSGGREHALVWKLAQSDEVSELACLPGSHAIGQVVLKSNGNLVRVVPGVKPTGAKVIADIAKEGGFDLVVPGPESCLEAELGDLCRKLGIPFAGPDRRGARFETSKAFAVRFCKDHCIGLPESRVCETVSSALECLEEWLGSRVVIKADGPALGKGVFLPTDYQGAITSVRALMIDGVCGHAGDKVVIQRFREGNEVSIHAVVDAHAALLLEAARDYKRAGDDDVGENTGGMGGYSPTSALSSEVLRQIQDGITGLWQDGCRAEQILYRGILYPGLIVSGNEVDVLEFNARFGDPETQLLMRRFTGDLANLLYASATDSLDPSMLSWSADSVVCVVMASRGYPGTPEVGKEITGLEEAEKIKGVKIFHAGTKLVNGKWYTSSGRVLGVTAKHPTMLGARMAAYEAVSRIRFEGAHYRSDIALEAIV